MERSCGPKIHNLVCVASWEVVTPDFDLLRWMEVEHEYKNVKTLYHGTSYHHVDKIVEEGLKPGRSTCMFGKGVYFGLPEKAIGYGRGIRAKYIIESQVVLGKIKVALKAEKYSLSSLQKDGCHSVHGKAGHTISWGGTLSLDEWVVYSEDQILITKIHEYQEKTIAPPIKTNDVCGLVVDKNVPTNKNNRTFADILKQQLCSNRATTKVRLDTKQVIWVCDGCIQKFNLKIGSKIKIKDRVKGVIEHRITFQE